MLKYFKFGHPAVFFSLEDILPAVKLYQADMEVGSLYICLFYTQVKNTSVEKSIVFHWHLFSFTNRQESMLSMGCLIDAVLIAQKDERKTYIYNISMAIGKCEDR